MGFWPLLWILKNPKIYPFLRLISYLQQLTLTWFSAPSFTVVVVSTVATLVVTGTGSIIDGDGRGGGGGAHRVSNPSLSNPHLTPLFSYSVSLSLSLRSPATNVLLPTDIIAVAPHRLSLFLSLSLSLSLWCFWYWGPPGLGAAGLASPS